MEVSLYMKLNPNKRIGKVLYLVEGDVDEVTILEWVFNRLLKYTTVTYDKRLDGVTCLINERDKYSKVFLVPMKYSAVSKIESSSDYADCVYKRLKSFGLEKDECVKYFVFDRDEGSNSSEMLMHLFTIFKNSLDNDLDINGLMLISYPCVQSFVCECFKDETCLSSSELMKRYSKCHEIKDIDEQRLIDGAEQMMAKVLKIIGQTVFDLNNLDDMQSINSEILKYQDNHFANKHVYYTLSMLFVSFIDLGIIEC